MAGLALQRLRRKARHECSECARWTRRAEERLMPRRSSWKGRSPVHRALVRRVISALFKSFPVSRKHAKRACPHGPVSPLAHELGTRADEPRRTRRRQRIRYGGPRRARYPRLPPRRGGNGSSVTEDAMLRTAGASSHWSQSCKHAVASTTADVEHGRVRIALSLDRDAALSTPQCTSSPVQYPYACRCGGARRDVEVRAGKWKEAGPRGCLARAG